MSYNIYNKATDSLEQIAGGADNRQIASISAKVDEVGARVDANISRILDWSKVSGQEDVAISSANSQNSMQTYDVTSDGFYFVSAYFNSSTSGTATACLWNNIGTIKITSSSSTGTYASAQSMIIYAKKGSKIYWSAQANNASNCVLKRLILD